jgi:trehalose synthase
MASLQEYAQVAGEEVVDHLRQLAKPLQGMRVVHVNATRQGGGVAEILRTLVPLMAELGLDVSWEVIEGSDLFYQCTKTFHNALQGRPDDPTQAMLAAYEDVNRLNAEAMAELLGQADVVFIHDPQPAALLSWLPERKGRWVWRCHIDISRPHRPVWKYLRGVVQHYDASIFSLASFAQPLPHPQYLIPPSIDPLSEKNMDLPTDEVESICRGFGLDMQRPWMLQVSRFDRFKDPLGVIKSYTLVKKYVPNVQLVLVGSGASDDPEGDTVLHDVRAAAAGDLDIHVLLLPPDGHRSINALQRGADIVLQKSTKEGFGLTVTEAMWKGKPVIGGDTGGIRLQVVDHYTGFLVSTPEGAALRARYLLQHREQFEKMGLIAHQFVREYFLLTRHLREYLTVMLGLVTHGGDYIEV